jgi:hypothetical protein
LSLRRLIEILLLVVVVDELDLVIDVRIGVDVVAAVSSSSILGRVSSSSRLAFFAFAFFAFAAAVGLLAPSLADGRWRVGRELDRSDAGRPERQRNDPHRSCRDDVFVLLATVPPLAVLVARHRAARHRAALVSHGSLD